MIQACAASLLEVYCDECCAAIAAQTAAEGLTLRPRFSPRLRGLPHLLPARPPACAGGPEGIGLTATETMMLTPTKSVTALVGLSPEAAPAGQAAAVPAARPTAPSVWSEGLAPSAEHSSQTLNNIPRRTFHGYPNRAGPPHPLLRRSHGHDAPGRRPARRAGAGALEPERPEVVRALHGQYLAAGADIIATNTFGANGVKLSGHPLEEIVAAAVRLAREAVEEAGRGWVALDVGPTGRLLQPMGDLPFEAAVEAYAREIRAGVQAGGGFGLSGDHERPV